MYRELASVGPVFGVRSGPYAGGVCRIAQSELPAPTLDRLTRAISGEGLPGVLARTPAPQQNARLLLTALGAIAFAAGVAAVQMDLLYLRWYWLPVFMACGAAIGVGMLAANQLRARSKLLPGLYLFPLDLIEIKGSYLYIRPLGGLRKAGIKSSPALSMLQLTFDGGTTVEFSAPQHDGAERIYQQLERAQANLEQLTLSPDLELAANNDLFFDLRDSDGWSDKLAARTPKAGIGGFSTATLWAVGVGAIAGAILLPVRNISSDNLEFAKACNQGTEDAYLLYLKESVTKRNADRAELRIAALKAMRANKVENENHLAVLDDLFHSADIRKLPHAQLSKTLQAEELRFIAEGEARYAKILPKDPKLRGLLHDVIERGKLAGQRSLLVQFTYEISPALAKAIANADEVGETTQTLRTCQFPLTTERAENYTIDALSTAISQVYSINLIGVGRANGGPTDLLIHYAIGITPEKRLTYTFHSSIHSPAQAEPLAKFTLTMPPPTGPATLRNNSILADTTRASSLSQCDLMTLRAFDRLYDELYGWFFSGPIRVPVITSMQR